MFTGWGTGKTETQDKLPVHRDRLARQAGTIRDR